MNKIAITIPSFFHGEGKAITGMLTDGGYLRVHIRKPEACDADVERLIREIPGHLRQRLTVHYHHAVARATGCGGIHLSASCPEIPDGWSGLVSRSLHSLEEIDTKPYDYAFLSPIYDSISKKGYSGRFSLDQLRGRINSRIFALGGVTSDKFAELAEAGFTGAAMLGAAWCPHISLSAFRLQLITHPLPDRSVVQEAEAALAGGCRWIQLRHKDADLPTLIDEGRAIRDLCNRYCSTFIIDDHVELVEAIDADGVHLGKNDMPVDEARRQLGPLKIIGATANTPDDIIRAASLGADYIGLGPFRFTSTKERLSAVLGLEGYIAALTGMRDRGIGLPVVAIGGITTSDISPLLATGIKGVAVSGSIVSAPDPAAATRRFADLLRIERNQKR